MSFSGGAVGKFPSCQDLESPFGFKSTKYHHNPLFKSSPTDTLAGDVIVHGDEDFKENLKDKTNINNTGGGKVTKVADSSSLTMTGSKRVLGERNRSPTTKGLDFTSGYNFDEPPKSIRAVAFPPMEQGSEDQTSSPLSSSTSSPSSRFTVPLTPVAAESPTGWSDSSDDDLVDGDGHNYDPKVNLRTPRPTFLRYRPDWRLEFLNSLELEQGESLANVFGKVEGEMTSSATEDTSTDFDKKVADGFYDSDLNTSSEDSEVVDALKYEDQRHELSEAVEVENQRHELSKVFQEHEGRTIEERAVDEEKVVPVDEETPKSARMTLRIATLAFLLGTLLAMVSMSTSSGFPGTMQVVNSLSKWLQPYQRTSSLESADGSYASSMMAEEGWDWIPEYDITKGYKNQTQDLQPFTTSSPELYELLMAILYGTEDEVEHKYLQLMEHEQVELQSYDQLADELHEDPVQDLPSEQEQQQHEQATQEEEHEQVTQEEEKHELTTQAQPQTITKNVMLGTTEASRSSVEDRLHEETTVPIINAAKLQNDLSRLKRFLTSKVIPMLVRTSLAAATLLGLRALVSVARKRSLQPRVTDGTDAHFSFKAVKPRVPEDLVITPECLKSSPYGSFTAYKRTVVNEGSENELVKLTPVRRSSRIRSHQQTPPCRRRVL